MASEYDFTNKTLANVTVSYGNYKGKLGRVDRKINAQLTLLHNSFSHVTSKHVAKDLEKAERFLDIMSSIADWMVAQKSEHAKDHADEVTQFIGAFELLQKNYMQLLHSASEGGDVTLDSDDETVPKSSCAKPISELKPKELAYDASASAVRDWKSRFIAYHTASNMRTLPLSTQQAFLVNTLATDISKRITRMASDTTPIFPVEGQVTCFDIIDQFFKEKIPLLHRRKAFFTYIQQEGQDATQLREELRSLADEGDIASMDVEGALCLMYTLSVRDRKLHEKLMEVTDPTLTKFNAVMDAYVQYQNGCKEFKTDKATGLRVQGGSSNKGKSNPNKDGRPKLSEDEKKRRKLIKNRCYRCGSADHMIPACKLSPTITCNTCKSQGHISPVCLKAVARVTSQDGPSAQQQSDSADSQLALTYDPSIPAAGYYATANPVFAAYGNPHNLPTPEVPL